MIKNNKAAGCGDTQAAQNNNCRINFSRLTLAFKVLCIQAATWLSLAGGAFL